MDKIYHGSFPKNADGTNSIIAAGEKCVVATNKCFWKEPCDVVKHGVKTRSRAYTEPSVDYKSFDDYYIKREWINRWVLGKEQKNNWLYYCYGQFALLCLLLTMGIFFQTEPMKENIDKENKKCNFYLH